MLKSAERLLEGKPKKGGWHKLVDILATDSLRVAVTAYSPTGVAEIKMGNIPEPLMNCLHDLAVCVVAPTPEAAAEAIAGSVPSTAEASESSSRFHLWLEQEASLGYLSSYIPQSTVLTVLRRIRISIIEYINNAIFIKPKTRLTGFGARKP